MIHPQKLSNIGFPAWWGEKHWHFSKSTIKLLVETHKYVKFEYSDITQKRTPALPCSSKGKHRKTCCYLGFFQVFVLFHHHGIHETNGIPKLVPWPCRHGTHKIQESGNAHQATGAWSSSRFAVSLVQAWERRTPESARWHRFGRYSGSDFFAEEGLVIPYYPPVN